MGAKTIQEVLHHENLVRVIQEVKDGVPQDILPPRMLNPTDKIQGNTGTYTKVEGTRQTAQMVMYGSPSKNVKMKGISKVPVTCVHAYEHFDHDPILLSLLKSLNGGDQLRGVEIVGKQLGQFGRRFVNLRYAAIYSALALGKIYIDGDGNLLATSAGAKITIDFGIPTGNQGQMDWDGNGAIIAADWATATTDIAAHLAELQVAAQALTGYKITTAYYGSNIPSYIAKNTAMKEFLKLNQGANKSILLQGQVPNGFQGIDKWIRASHAFFEDHLNVNKFFWGVDTIVFTPDIADVGWWGLLEGSYEIPTDIGRISGDALAAINTLRKIFGMFSYAKVTDDPVGIRHFGGDTFLPYIAVPKAVFIADVTP